MDPKARPDERVQCIHCHALFEPDDVISFQGCWLCGACKPTVIKSVESGIALEDRVVARTGKFIVKGCKASLPDRCIKCNASARGKTTKIEIRRDSNWILLLFLVFMIPGAQRYSALIFIVIILVAFFSQQRITIHFSYCQNHWMKRIRDLAICVISVFGGIAICCAAIVKPGHYLFAIGIMVALLGAVYGAIATATLTLKKVDGQFVRQNGAGKPFLDSLPEWGKLRQ